MPIQPSDVTGGASRLVVAAEELHEDEVIIPTAWARLLVELAKLAKSPRRALLEANKRATSPEKIPGRGRLPMSTREQVRKAVNENKKHMVLARGRTMRAELRKQGVSGTVATDRVVFKIKPELEKVSKSKKGLTAKNIKRMLEKKDSGK